MMMTLTLEVPGELRDVSFLTDIMARYARHMAGDGATAPTLEGVVHLVGEVSAELVDEMQRLGRGVTSNARWLLVAIAQQTLAGAQPRGKTLRRLFAEQHDVAQPNEGTLGAWVRSINAAVTRLAVTKPFNAGYPDSPEAVYTMREDIARAVIAALAPNAFGHRLRSSS
jgi:hypothetical protein